jgi:hypothetical protein
MTDPTCDAFKDQIPELALGVLHGRERTEAIAHIEQCQSCHEELLLMGGLADQLVDLTPAAEPAPGFEIGVLAAIKAARPNPAPPKRRRRRLPTLIAVAAAVAIAFGIGGWVIGRTGPRGGRTAVSAALVSHGKRIGEVVETKGEYPWVYMDVDTDLGDRIVICELHERDGGVYRVGAFRLKNGAGYWGAALPQDATDLSGARLINASGQTVAVATLQ